MRYILLLLLLLIIPSASAITLFEDNFNDGDYTNNPAWDIVYGSPFILSNKFHGGNLDVGGSGDIITDTSISSIQSLNVSYTIFGNWTAGNTVEVYLTNLGDQYGDYIFGHIHVVQVLGNGTNQIFFSVGDIIGTTGITESTLLMQDNAEHTILLVYNNDNRNLSMYIDSVYKVGRTIGEATPLNFSRVEIYAREVNNNSYVDNIVISDNTIITQSAIISVCSYPDFSSLAFYDIIGYLRLILIYLFNVPPCMFNILLDFLYAYFYLITAPFIGIITMALVPVLSILTNILDIAIAIGVLASSINNFFSGTIGVLFDYEWVLIMSTGISLVVFLRIYAFIKGQG